MSVLLHRALTVIHTLIAPKAAAQIALLNLTMTDSQDSWLFNQQVPTTPWLPSVLHTQLFLLVC